MKSLMSRFSTMVVCATLALCSAALVSVEGCSTLTGAGGASNQVVVTVLVDAAVGVAVQNGSSDPAVWSKKAATIVSIANQLKAIDQGAIATLPLVTAALQPLILKANLGPADMLAANVLIGALSQFIAAKVPADAAQTTAIQLVLNNVIAAASVYLPPAPTT